LPVYGRGFVLKFPLLQHGLYAPAKAGYVVGFPEACRLEANASRTRVWLDEAASPYIYRGSNWTSHFYFILIFDIGKNVMKNF
jgi:hypothetical protein